MVKVHNVQYFWIEEESMEGFVRFEALTAGTMENAIFWGIKFQFSPHRRHITSPLQSLAG
jgi:hypothetical protein